MVVMITGNTTIAVMIPRQESTDEKMPRSWVDYTEGKNFFTKTEST